jgi:hypothetical protein
MKNLKKRITALILTISMIFSLIVPIQVSANTPDTSIGTEAGISDALDTLKHLANVQKLTGWREVQLDVDFDEAITINDTLIILKGLAGISCRPILKPEPTEPPTDEPTEPTEEIPTTEPTEEVPTTEPTEELPCECGCCEECGECGVCEVCDPICKECGKKEECPCKDGEKDFKVVDYTRICLPDNVKSGAQVYTAGSLDELYYVVENQERNCNWGGFCGANMGCIDPVERFEARANVFDENLFKDKMAIVLYFAGGSGFERTIVNSLIRNGNSLTITTETGEPCATTADLSAWRIILMVDRSEVYGTSIVRDYKYMGWFCSRKENEGCDFGDCVIIWCKWFNDWLDKRFVGIASPLI